MIGTRGETLTELSPHGLIRCQGEVWSATADQLILGRDLEPPAIMLSPRVARRGRGGCRFRDAALHRLGGDGGACYTPAHAGRWWDRMGALLLTPDSILCSPSSCSAIRHQRLSGRRCGGVWRWDHPTMSFAEWEGEQ